MSTARHTPPVPVTLVALAHAATGDSTFDALTPLYAMMPRFLDAVRQGRIDGRGHAESVESIVQTVTDACLKWTRTQYPGDNAYEDRQRLRAVLEAADLDADQELLDVWAPAAVAGFLTGAAYLFCALTGEAGAVVVTPRDISARHRPAARPPRRAGPGRTVAPDSPPATSPDMTLSSPATTR